MCGRRLFRVSCGSIANILKFVIPAGTSRIRGNFLFTLIACLVGWAGLPARSTSAPLPDLTFRSWNKQQGLPDDSVTAVLQTRDGYLWVGTSSGLARFDGVKFTVMSPPDGKSNAPICITALCEDSKNRLWIGTQDNGLLCYENGAVNSRSNLDGLHVKTINSIAEDTNGTLWLGTPSGLEKLDGPAFTHFTAQNGLPNDFVSNVHVARSGTVWITTRGGMCQFKNGHLEPFPFETDNPGRNPESLGVYEDRRGKLWAFGDTYLVNLTDGQHLNHFGTGDAASTRIWSLCEGQKGELWIGTSGKGLYCFNGDTFVAPTLYNGELTSDVRAICEDRQGNLWLGTHNDGLVRLQPRNIRVLNTASGLPNRSAVCLAFNPQGHAWIGFDRAGLYEGSAGTFVRVSNDIFPNLQNLVSTVCVTSNSTLWAGTPGAGLYCIENQKCMRLTTVNGLSDNSILALAVDSENALWVGTAARLHRIVNGTITGFGTAEGLPDQPVTSILPARNGGVWLGFNNGAVFREHHGQFRRISAPSVAASKSIRAMCEDPQGRIWIGTDGGHLGCITDNQTVGWDLPPGTSDTCILGIVTSNDGDLWLGTDSSVYSIAQRDITAWIAGQGPLHQHLVYRADSILSTAPTQGWPRALNAPGGTLWFAMDSGIVAIDLNSSAPDSAPPPVLIENVLVNGEPLPGELLKKSPAKVPLRLSSDIRSLDVHFTALDLSAPEKIRFRHRLEGSDQDWVTDNSLIRDVHYPRLPYGKYTFRVQAGDADQTWFDNAASFAFVVPTPLWRAPWALTLYALALLALTGGAARLVSARRFRRRLAVIAAQQAMERERMRIARDMHDEIGSKLTKISFMTERVKREFQGQDSVAQKLDSIAGTSRDLLQTLDEIVWAVNPHNDTLEHLAAYLGQYATEYLQNTSVECELHIPRGLPHYPLSAEARHNLFLAFEESLNNALKHGRATRVRVDMQLEPSRFDIIIQDNGRGFSAKAVEPAGNENGSLSRTGGNGLSNMRQRLDLLGGQCTVDSIPGRGTTVILSVPLTSKTLLTANGAKK
jgi:ligand-binding sensor domain-containing protein/signal transduction histidine kinase